MTAGEYGIFGGEEGDKSHHGGDGCTILNILEATELLIYPSSGCVYGT